MKNPIELYREYKALKSTVGMLRENLDQLSAMQEMGYQRLSAHDSEGLTEDTIRLLMRTGYYMWIWNPLINRAANVQASYVFGREMQFTSENDRTRNILNEFWNDRHNQSQLTGLPALVLRDEELEFQGNLFVATINTPGTRPPQIRIIPPEQITDIITDPDDAGRVVAYKRIYTPIVYRNGQRSAGKTETKYYQDWAYDGIDALPVERGILVYHMHINKAKNAKFGIPGFTSAINWAKAYKNFLEDWASFVESLTTFAWKIKGKDATKVKSMASKLNELRSQVAGGAAGAYGDGDLDPIKIGGAALNSEQGRALLLMVCAGTGISEHLLGDPSKSNLATATSLERPTELKFTLRQNIWKSALENILKIVAQYRGVKNVDDIDVNFPPILEHKTKDLVDATVNAITLGGRPASDIIPDPIYRTEMILKSLGIDDVEKALDILYGDNRSVADERLKKIEEAISKYKAKNNA